MGSREILSPDLQASPPEVRIGLSRVGVTGVSKAIRLSHGGKEKLIAAEIDCAVDLDPAQKGVHMSRFPELFEEAIEEVVIGEAFLVEVLAEHIATHIVERQQALRAHVHISARYPIERTTPVTGLPTQEMVELVGIAAATAHGVRGLVGVQAAHGDARRQRCAIGQTPCVERLDRVARRVAARNADAPRPRCAHHVAQHEAQPMAARLECLGHRTQARGVAQVGPQFPRQKKVRHGRLRFRLNYSSKRRPSPKRCVR
jgi:hypothetical protein